MTEIGKPQREHECEPLVEPIPGPSQPVRLDPEPAQLPPQRTAPERDPVRV